MKDEFIKLAEYLERLEARIAALEDKNAALVEKNTALESQLAALREQQKAQPAHTEHDVVLAQRIAILAERLEAIEARGVVPTQNNIPAQDNEQGPEIEVELVVEDEEPEEPETAAPVEEPVEEPIAEPIAEPEQEPVPAAEEPVMEVPEVEAPSIAEPEPIVEEEKAQPQQTSLFGQPVTTIRQAISLGDRFLFQRELFRQNGELMQKTLDELDHLISLDDALAYIDKHFDWDKQSSTYELFINVLHRRFS